MINHWRKYSLWLCLLVCAGWRGAVVDVTLSKSFAKTYAAASVERLMVENQLGDVVVHTHAKDEIIVKVLMKATKRTQSEAERALGLLSVVESEEDGLLMLITSIDGALKNSPGESVNISYQIWLPTNQALSLSNTFGKVTVGDLSAPELFLSVEYGNLEAGNLTGPKSAIEVSYGTGGHIAKVTEGEIRLAYAKGFSIDEVGEVSLQLESTPLRIKKAQNILLDHEYGSLEIEELAVLSGDLSYGELTIGRLTRSLELSGSYTRGFIINEVTSAVVLLELSMDYGKGKLVFGKGTKANINAKVWGEGFRWEGNAFNIRQTKAEAGQYFQFEGTRSGDGNTQVNITQRYGTLVLMD